MKPVEEQLALIQRGADEILVEVELVVKLERGQPLRIKAGFDPTAPDLHLGHIVLVNKLCQFQGPGHQAILLIGDFIGVIGDPSRKSVTRPSPTREQVLENVETHKSQVFKTFDSVKTEVTFNSIWMGQLTLADSTRLASRYTVACMLERSDSSKHYTSNQLIVTREFLYPLVQDCDSIVLKVDVELGGTDQKFNLLVGREPQCAYGQEAQVILTIPLLEGLDGVKKMSRSLGNYIGIQKVPGVIYSKLVSTPDMSMWRYFELLSSHLLGEIDGFRRGVEADASPCDTKIKLAEEIVVHFHDEGAAASAHKSVGNRLKEGGLPEDLSEIELPSPEDVPVASAFNKVGLVKNAAAARDLLGVGSVKVDRQVVDRIFMLTLGETRMFQAGKKAFACITLKVE